MHAASVRANEQHWYINLNGSLIAIRESDTTTGVVSTTYQHTDALGSPVAVTSASRAVLQCSEYEPYGKLLNRTREFVLRVAQGRYENRLNLWPKG